MSRASLHHRWNLRHGTCASNKRVDDSALSPASKLPDEVARHIEPTTAWPGVQTLSDPSSPKYDLEAWGERYSHQMKANRERLHRQSTIAASSERASSLMSRSRSRSTPDSRFRESWDDDPKGQEEDKGIPYYPIFGDIRPDSSTAEHPYPHEKAHDIWRRACGHPECPSGQCICSRPDALKRATAEWLRDSNPGRRAFGQGHEPCVVCHADPADLAGTVLVPGIGFSSSLTLQYNDLENYAWALGRRYVVRERLDWDLHPERLPAEVEAARLLRCWPETAAGRVPVPEVVAAWKEGHVAITIMERARGRTLAEVWHTLEQKHRERYARQVGSYARRWRTLMSPSMEGIDGGTIFKWAHVPGGGDFGKSPMRFDTVVEYKDIVRKELMTLGAGLKEQVREALEHMPDPGPFTLTHGYLDLDHIFVDDKNVAAIVGWSRAAYLPVWAEHLGLCIGYDSPPHREWKELLLRNMPGGSYYGKAPLDIFKGEALARQCEEGCDSMVEEREKKDLVREPGKRRESSAHRARLLEEKRQTALEKGAEELERAKKEKEKQVTRAKPDAGISITTADGDEEMREEKKPVEDPTENLTASMFFLNVEEERTRAKKSKEDYLNVFALKPPDRGGAGAGGGGGSSSGGHRRVVSAFPSFSNNRSRSRSRSPLGYKPQDKDVQARRPSELESRKDVDPPKGIELSKTTKSRRVQEAIRKMGLE
ncbi:Protein kinase-like domain [Apiospora aurea]|uniref:Protein kinase-like domain n=1 Tax=Apiospora aurea TaxID=335848 RepID=A0ABR1PUT0_9PEZI